MHAISSTANIGNNHASQNLSVGSSLNALYNYCRDHFSSLSDYFSRALRPAIERDVSVLTGDNNSEVHTNFDLFELRVQRTELTLSDQIQLDIDLLVQIGHTMLESEVKHHYGKLSKATQDMIISVLAHVYNKTDFPEKMKSYFHQDIKFFINLEIPPVVHSGGGTLLDQIIHHLQLEDSKNKLMQSMASVDNLIRAIDDPRYDNTELLTLFDQLPQRVRNATYGQVYALCKKIIPSQFAGTRAGEKYARHNIRMLKDLIQPSTGLTLLENIKSLSCAYQPEQIIAAENKQLFIERYKSNLYDHQELKQLWKTLSLDARSEILIEFNITSTVDEVHFYGKGVQSELYKHFGAHRKHNGEVLFRVFAPNAVNVEIDLIKKCTKESKNTVSSGKKIPMTKNKENGEWEVKARNIPNGSMYQYMIYTSKARPPHRKSDPYAKQTIIGYLKGHFQQFSVVTDEEFAWGDLETSFLEKRSVNANNPIKKSTIYELHVTSWRKKRDGSTLNWVELAHELVGYCKDLNYTHVELMGAMEHPSENSWGYQPSSCFSMNHRMGSLSDFKRFVQIMHQNDIHVILDFVPGHFALDGFHTSKFDGSAIYEHSNTRRNLLNWGVLSHDLEKRYVRDYLISSAKYHTQELHIDGLRIDACDAMLHTNICRLHDPSNKPISLPHPRGKQAYTHYENGIKIAGHTHPDTKKFFRDLHCIIDKNPDQTNSGIATYAEDSYNFPLITAPVSYKTLRRSDHAFNTRGLGFKYMWYMSGNRKIRENYFSMAPRHRKLSPIVGSLSLSHSNQLPVVIAENHDLYSHGKTRKFCSSEPTSDHGTIQRERRSQYQLYQAFRYMLPGLKLNMMGVELDQMQEWSSRLKDSVKNNSRKSAVQWELLSCGSRYHPAVQTLFRDLNDLYLTHPALHSDNHSGRATIVHSNQNEHIVGFLRQYTSSDHATDQVLLCVANFRATNFPSYELKFDQSIDPIARISSFNPTPIFTLDGYYPRPQQHLTLSSISSTRTGKIKYVNMTVPPYSLQVFEARFI